VSSYTFIDAKVTALVAPCETCWVLLVSSRKATRITAAFVAEQGQWSFCRSAATGVGRSPDPSPQLDETIQKGGDKKKFLSAKLKKKPTYLQQLEPHRDSRSFADTKHWLNRTFATSPFLQSTNEAGLRRTTNMSDKLSTYAMTSVLVTIEGRIALAANALCAAAKTRACSAEMLFARRP
jgi:hypothetical protein